MLGISLAIGANALPALVARVTTYLCTKFNCGSNLMGSTHRNATHRFREQLAATGQTVPIQLKQPTDRPTMRWMFQCFEGISLVAFTLPNGPPHRAIAGLELLHAHVVALLGPSCANLYNVDA